jgi:hypothetical protein
LERGKEGQRHVRFWLSVTVFTGLHPGTGHDFFLASQ